MRLRRTERGKGQIGRHKLQTQRLSESSRLFAATGQHTQYYQWRREAQRYDEKSDRNSIIVMIIRHPEQEHPTLHLREHKYSLLQTSKLSDVNSSLRSGTRNRRKEYESSDVKKL